MKCKPITPHLCLWLDKKSTALFGIACTEDEVTCTFCFGCNKEIFCFISNLNNIEREKMSQGLKPDQLTGKGVKGAVDGGVVIDG